MLSLSFTTLVLFPSFASAFLTNGITTNSQSLWVTTTSSLQGTSKVDSADQIAEAMSLCNEFGSDSDECRVAWDIVEEMDSNDSR